MIIYHLTSTDGFCFLPRKQQTMPMVEACWTMWHTGGSTPNMQSSAWWKHSTPFRISTPCLDSSRGGVRARWLVYLITFGWRLRTCRLKLVHENSGVENSKIHQTSAIYILLIFVLWVARSILSFCFLFKVESSFPWQCWQSRLLTCFVCEWMQLHTVLMILMLV